MAKKKIQYRMVCIDNYKGMPLDYDKHAAETGNLSVARAYMDSGMTAGKSDVDRILIRKRALSIVNYDGNILKEIKGNGSLERFADHSGVTLDTIKEIQKAIARIGLEARLGDKVEQDIAKQTRFRARRDKFLSSYNAPSSSRRQSKASGARPRNN